MFKRIICFYAAVSFLFTFYIPIPKAQAGHLLGLPEPGAMVSLSPTYQPAIIKGDNEKFLAGD